MRLGWVEVVGDSMLPTLRGGDLVLVRWGGVPKPGKVVVACWPQRPDVLAVKRVDHLTAAGAWLLGDRPQSSDDSRTLGEVTRAAVVGVVVAGGRVRRRQVREHGSRR